MRMFIVFALVALCGVPAFAEEVYTRGQFRMAMDPDNSWLPDSIRWEPKDAELLSEGKGFGHGFTSFEARAKIYHNDNAKVRKKWDDPRLILNGKNAAKSSVPEDADGFAGVAVDYESSYAKVRRTILFHKDAPRIRYQYEFEAARDLVIHESGAFSLSVRFAKGFSRRQMWDARTNQEKVLTDDTRDPVAFALTFLNPGPQVVTNPEKAVSVVLSGKVSGDLPDPIPARLLQLKKGQTFSLAVELRCFAKDDQGVLQVMRESKGPMTDARKGYLLLANALVFKNQKKDDEAEKLLLRAAQLNKEDCRPYAALVGIRRRVKDKNAPGLKPVDCYIEAAYRMPYNYGYVGRGRGFVEDERLTEEERRLALFNMLISLENTMFYPDYYYWSAQYFENLNMYGQACAVYRQALWAVDYMPRTDEYKAKYRARFEEKIAELEKKLVGQTLTDLPELIPVRVDQSKGK